MYDEQKLQKTKVWFCLVDIKGILNGHQICTLTMATSIKKRNDLKQHILFLSFNSLDKPNGDCLNLFDK